MISFPFIVMDKNQDPIIFEAYKPFRNAIRKLGLADSLAVIRAYMCNLQFNQNIPSDCEVHRDYAAASYSKKAAWISEFHLETICREVVLHAKEFGRTEDTLKDWKTLARTVSRLKKLEEVIAGRYRSPDLLMQELHRMAHRQFPWQAFRPNAENITRYHMIYGYAPLTRMKFPAASYGVSCEILRNHYPPSPWLRRALLAFIPVASYGVFGEGE